MLRKTYHSNRATHTEAMKVPPISSEIYGYNIYLTVHFLSYFFRTSKKGKNVFYHSQYQSDRLRFQQSINFLYSE